MTRYDNWGIKDGVIYRVDSPEDQVEACKPSEYTHRQLAVVYERCVCVYAGYE